MLETIESKVAIVTGSTRGIGRAIAKRLLAEGARVAICGTRQKSVDDALELLTPKERVFGMVADVSKLEDVRQFIGAVKQHFGEIHILINNAGVGIYRSVRHAAGNSRARSLEQEFEARKRNRIYTQPCSSAGFHGRACRG